MKRSILLTGLVWLVPMILIAGEPEKKSKEMPVYGNWKTYRQYWQEEGKAAFEAYMRRKDKEISDSSTIKTIIQNSSVCRLAMINGDKPYIVPLSFGFHENSLYFHGALKGLKIDLLKENPNVCFEFDTLYETITSEKACDFSMKYQSVVGTGKAVFIKDFDEKYT